MHKIIRPLFLGLIPILLGTHAISQAAITPAMEDNLYSLALAASITEMEKSWGQVDDGDNGSRVRTDYGHLIAWQKSEITSDLPIQFGTHHIEFLDDRALIDRYKKLGKEFAILEIHPMRNEGSKLRIHVSVSWFSYHRGRLNFASSDWSDVEFQYDCDKKKFKLTSVEVGGI
jgi:hypothetical protein